MKKTLAVILVMLLCLLTACTEDTQSITVAKNGTTEYALTYSSRFSETRIQLCSQFAQELEQRTGAAFALQTDRDSVDGPQIVIGQTSAEASDALQQAVDAAGGNRFGICQDAGNLYITGTGIYQTYLAMAYLLENYVSGEGTLAVPVGLNYISDENKNLSGEDMQSLLDQGRGVQFVPAQAKLLLSGTTKYSTVQAVCTDGTYLYAAFCRNVRQERTTPETAVVQKYDLQTGELLATSQEMELNHANDMTYDPTRQQLLVSCAKGVGNWYEGKRLAYVDPQTLELVEYVDADVYLRTVRYLPEQDCYVGAGDDNFYLLDKNFQMTSSFPCQDPQYSKQALCCDGQYIYDVRFRERAAQEEPLVIHKLDGTYIGTVSIADMADNEPECMFILDGEYYLACHLSRILYQVELLPQTWW